MKILAGRKWIRRWVGLTFRRAPEAGTPSEARAGVGNYSSSTLPFCPALFNSLPMDQNQRNYGNTPPLPIPTAIHLIFPPPFAGDFSW